MFKKKGDGITNPIIKGVTISGFCAQDMDTERKRKSFYKLLVHEILSNKWAIRYDQEAI